MAVYARDPPMTEYTFTRIIAVYQESGDVVFTPSSEIETIYLASDWLEGEQLAAERKPFHETGYIGSGYSKRGIYVSLLRCYSLLIITIIICVEPLQW